MRSRTLFSKRTLWETQPNALSRVLADKKMKGERILDLTESNPTRCGFRYPNSDWFAPLSYPENALYEADPRGLLSAREAVARYYAEKGISVRPERIFLTASTSEAYAHLFKLLCDPGENVAAPEPSYPLFGFLSGLNDVALCPYSLDFQKGSEGRSSWSINVGSLESLRTKNPKAVITVNPNNPTGHFAGKEDRALLNAFCRREGAALIADEVFLDYPLETGGPAPLSFASNQDGLTFILSGISKILGLPQMKLSWIVLSGPEAEVHEAAEKLEVILDTFLSVNTPAQRALPAWLSKKDEAISEIQERISGNLVVLSDILSMSEGFEVLRPEGGWYAVLKVNSAKSDEDLSLEMLEKYNVLVHPGYFFEWPSENFLVLSLLAPPQVFHEGVKRLSGASL